MFRRFSVRLELCTDLVVYAPANATAQEVEEAARSIARGSWYDYRDWFDQNLEFSVYEFPHLYEEVGQGPDDFALHGGEFVNPNDAPWTRVVIRKPPEASPEDDHQTKLPF